MTHQDLDTDFAERLDRDRDPNELPNEMPNEMPSKNDEALRLRQKMLKRLPELESAGFCDVPNQRFWDYYNSGGKERLHAAGIILRKQNSDYFLTLLDELPAVTRQRELDALLTKFPLKCPSCGKGVLLEKKVCSNAAVQFRVRCQGWHEDKSYWKGWGMYRRKVFKRGCYSYPRSSDQKPHFFAEHLMRLGVPVREVDEKGNLTEDL